MAYNWFFEKQHPKLVTATIAPYNDAPATMCERAHTNLWEFDTWFKFR